MTNTSREYAEALFALALEADQAEAFAEGLETVEQAIGENPGFLNLLASPAIPREQRIDALSQAFEERIPLPELILLRMMVSRGQAGSVSGMIREFRSLQRENRGESEARVISAVPLTEAERESLKAKLEKRFGRKMALNCEVDPSLLGGIRVETEGRVLDGSLRARLQEMKEVMDS